MSNAANAHRELLALCSLTDGGDRCDWGVIARQAHRERTLDPLEEGTVIESSERAHRTGWLVATASPVQWASAYDRADAELEAAAAHGARMTTVLDDDYPTNLRFIHNLPPFLFYRGVLDPHRDARSIAVVGTRNATTEGLNRAHHMARKLAEHDVSIVSGLARGIDSAAHRTAPRFVRPLVHVDGKATRPIRLPLIAHTMLVDLPVGRGNEPDASQSSERQVDPERLVE